MVLTWPAPHVPGIKVQLPEPMADTVANNKLIRYVTVHLIGNQQFESTVSFVVAPMETSRH